MEKFVKVHVINNDTTVEVPIGSNLEEVYEKSGFKMEYGPLNAHVNNKVEGASWSPVPPIRAAIAGGTASRGAISIQGEARNWRLTTYSRIRERCQA